MCSCKKIFSQTWIYSRSCDALPVQCQTDGYLPIHTTRPWPVLILVSLGVGGWVGLHSWLHTEAVNLLVVTHLSTNRLDVEQLGLMWALTSAAQDLHCQVLVLLILFRLLQFLCQWLVSVNPSLLSYIRRVSGFHASSLSAFCCCCLVTASVPSYLSSVACVVLF